MGDGYSVKQKVRKKGNGEMETTKLDSWGFMAGEEASSFYVADAICVDIVFVLSVCCQALTGGEDFHWYPRV